MKLIIINAFRDRKKYFIFYLLFQLIFIFLVLLVSNYEFYNYQINYVIGAQENNRGLEANNNNQSPEAIFNDIKYIKEYYPLYDNQTIYYDHKQFQVNQIFNNDIKYGKNIENKDEIILSIYCFKQLNLNEEDIGNKEMTLSYNNEEHKFKIVGVTNNNHTQIYLSKESFTRIFEIKPKSYYLLVDEYLNVSKTKKILEEKNIVSGLYNDTDLKKIEDIKKIQKQYSYIFVILMLLVVYFIKSIIKNIATSERKNIALLKILGYKTKIIKRIISLRLSIVIIITCFSTLVLTLIINLFIRRTNIVFYFKAISLICLLIMIIKNIYILNLKSKIKRINALETIQDI